MRSFHFVPHTYQLINGIDLNSETQIYCSHASPEPLALLILCRSFAQQRRYVKYFV